MKKLSLLIILASCASLLLSSCSRLENISVTKRHYRSGFYVDLGSRKPEAPKQQVSETVKPKTTPSASNYAEDKSVISQQKDISPPAPVVSTVLAEKKKQAHKNAATVIYASAQKSSETATDIQASIFKSYVTSLPDLNSVNNGHSSESLPFWFIVLCCIFIPPLGVALYFGFDTHFWICLVLTLLFFFPGMIYALIVVLQ